MKVKGVSENVLFWPRLFSIILFIKINSRRIKKQKFYSMRLSTKHEHESGDGDDQEDSIL